MQFTDSVSENVEILRELLGGLMPEHRRRAKKAAVALENVFNDLKKDYPRDPAVALGAAFAIFIMAQRMVEAPKQGDKVADGMGLIHLL
jgi:hypothetical protein